MDFVVPICVCIHTYTYVCLPKKVKKSPYPVTRWPSNPGCLFLECLMGNCQYVQLQVSAIEYFRFNHSDKEWDFRNFFLCKCYLRFNWLIIRTTII